MNKVLYFDLIVSILLLITFYLAKKRIFFKKVLIITYILLTLIYLGWRILYTIPFHGILNLVFSILLLAAEIGGFALALIFYLLFLQKNTRPKHSLANLKDQYPSVDIYIATYNEDETILRRAIVAAQNLRYPEKSKLAVYVLDDGSRKNIQKLTANLGAHYLKRETHEHAKAGNLNNALAQTTGDLIVTLDADMVVRTNFLEQTIGYFADPKFGFIQSPQTFFNHDPYQFNLFSPDNLGNDQDFFMRNIEEQKDRFNATMYIGSNAVFRRTALEEIGGFSTGVITEDMATGMLIQAKGWRSRFVNENLASGLAPETFADLIKQRDRWARGNIQVARKWNPLRVKGLKIIQKIIYLDGIHYWISSIYKMIYLLAPLFFLLFGIYSLNASLQGILFFWFPAFLASQLTFNTVSGGKQNVLLTNIYETVMAPYMSAAVLSELLLKTQKKFAVTRKGFNSKKTYYNLKLAAPILVLLILSLASFIKSLLILGSFIPFAQPLNSLYINLFWISYNLFALLIASFIPFERPRLRKAERFLANKPAKISFPSATKLTIPGLITDWNELGANFVIDHPLNNPVNASITLSVAGHSIQGKVLRYFSRADKKFDLGIEFQKLSSKNYTYLILQTYALSSNEYIEVTHKNNVWKIITALAKRHYLYIRKVNDD
ncbi:glycosyltransferase family 2 protein [Liquorilactobacillus satsumensis]|uniref:glycosyltransferase family 2 protein n=1 Tax=Liquorilactobacillus satsumensis TaxID=259059 RepID=UPI0039E95FEB